VAQSESCIADCANQATCTQVHDYECSPLSTSTPLGSCIQQCGTSFPGIFPGALQPGHPLYIYTCSDGNHVGRCDDKRECSDGADEKGCPMFACANGQMILEIKHCDYMTVDCSDGSDEADCSGGGIFHCTQGPLIVASQQCDGMSQCQDGSDEKTCFTCGDGKKLVPYKQCNLSRDCTDGKDELGCAQILCDAPPP
jgi:hypothetical protein